MRFRPHVVTEWTRDGSLFRIWSVPAGRAVGPFVLPRLVWTVTRLEAQREFENSVTTQVEPLRVPDDIQAPKIGPV